MSDTTITNARIVLPGEIVAGGMAVRQGMIAGIDCGGTALTGAIDFEGDYLLPGFVELHTDNLEKHLQPRPGVMWPSSAAAVLSHDTQVAGAGITTVFDAVSVGEYSAKSNRRQMIASTVATLSQRRCATCCAPSTCCTCAANWPTPRCSKSTSRWPTIRSCA
jgi:alpha-D-ribose 1-methylphosphonate 5-triphosphate diphosphatase